MTLTADLPLFASTKTAQWVRLLEYLRAHNGTATTMQIILDTGITAVSQRMQDLAKNGYPYDCKFVGMSEGGAKIYRYWLI